MKRNVFVKLVFAVLAVLCVFLVGSGGGLESAAGVVLASAPLAATFNPENLKIPVSEWEALKAKYKNLYVLDIEIDETEKYQFIARRPSRETISAVAANRDNLDKANDIIIKNMIIAGDKDALDDGIVYSRVLTELGQIMQQGKSVFTKA